MYVHVCIYACMYLCIYVHIYCKFMYMSACRHMRLYVCRYDCTHLVFVMRSTLFVTLIWIHWLEHILIKWSDRRVVPWIFSHAVIYFHYWYHWKWLLMRVTYDTCKCRYVGSLCLREIRAGIKSIRQEIAAEEIHGPYRPILWHQKDHKSMLNSEI